MELPNRKKLTNLITFTRAASTSCDGVRSFQLSETLKNLGELSRELESLADRFYCVKIEGCDRNAILLLREADRCVSDAMESIKRSINIASRDVGDEDYDLYGVEVDLCKAFLRKAAIILCNAQEIV